LYGLKSLVVRPRVASSPAGVSRRIGGRRASGISGKRSASSHSAFVGPRSKVQSPRSTVQGPGSVGRRLWTLDLGRWTAGRAAAQERGEREYPIMFVGIRCCASGRFFSILPPFPNVP